MKAIINPRTGIFKQLTEKQFKLDEQFLKADGFREMTDKEIQDHFGYKPTTAKGDIKAAIKTK